MDDKVGMWLQDLPYIWVEGESVKKCYRFYLLHLNSCVAYDKKGYAIDPAIMVDKMITNETFSLFPLTKKDCKTARNYFLLYLYNDPNAAGFDVDKLLNSSIRRRLGAKYVEIRVNGKKAMPHKVPRIMDQMVTIISRDHQQKWEKIVLPYEFGNIRAVALGPYEPIKYRGETYRNLYDVVKKMDLGKYDIDEIHQLAINEEEGWSYINKSSESRKKQEVIYEVAMGFIKNPLLRTNEGIAKYQWASEERSLGDFRPSIPAIQRKVTIVK